MTKSTKGHRTEQRKGRPPLKVKRKRGNGSLNCENQRYYRKAFLKNDILISSKKNHLDFVLFYQLKSINFYLFSQEKTFHISFNFHSAWFFFPTFSFSSTSLFFLIFCQRFKKASKHDKNPKTCGLKMTKTTNNPQIKNFFLSYLFSCSSKNWFIFFFHLSSNLKKIRKNRFTNHFLLWNMLM